MKTQTENGSKYYTTDIKMFELADILKDRGIIRFYVEFCEKIGICPTNFSRMRAAGGRHFTPDQLQRACVEYDVNANWLFGLSQQIWSNLRSN